MSLIKMIAVLVLTITISSCKKENTNSLKPNDVVQIEYPEAYELANIILALTEYGKTDKWEVRQGFEYYDKIQEYFKPVSNHPLLDSVNYSRERWKDYLSFRTDAYAFSFDQNNKLKRNLDFYTNEGFTPFDNHLDLINDFVEKSNFRIFFSQNKEYRNTVIEKYKKTQYLNEMRHFLISEFGEQISLDKKYNVVLSPFVYRMNCHREIDSATTADFITVPNYVLSDTISVSDRDQAISLHNLFTEMDHGYVNPTTKEWNDLVEKSFDETKWSLESGYENSGNAVFNEYMTWAVYDIFLQKHFPQFVEEIGLYWSFQNETRGFLYSQLFTQKLVSLYNVSNEGAKIADLYPELLKWTSEVQNDFTKPQVVFPIDSLAIEFSSKSNIKVLFSEPMEKTKRFSIIMQDENNKKEVKQITVNKNNLTWSNDGKQMSISLDLPSNKQHLYILFNWWDTKYPLMSQKNILLKTSSYFKLINKK